LSTVNIRIEKPYQERCGFYGKTGSGKSNCMAYCLQRTKCKFILIDMEGVHNWTPLDPKRQIIIQGKRGMDKHALLMQVLHKVMNEKYYILAVEGMDAFQTPRWLPDDLRDFVQYGRNYKWGRSSLWVAFRRCADVHKSIVANIDHHFIFRSFEPNDVHNYYRKYLGKDVALRLQSLPDYHFYYWNPPRAPVLSSPVKKVI